ncbi:ABC transporter permease subunit [Falsiroseomonas sp. CW058]|uniref:ABC transporter permease subunit n=1 Tax=Falsiroseomonas sp. CW058 TaxID=3388664 RepID=UPI003D31B39E
MRAFAWQALALALVAGAAAWLWGNVTGNLARRNLGIDFGFLGSRASFEFGENLVGYRGGDTFLRAFQAGLANTVLVAVAGIALTTVAAVALALMRLSPNRLARNLAWAWIELVRNTPLLLQLLFWHQVTIRQLPGPRQAWEVLPDVFLSNRGLYLPAILAQPAFGQAAVALLIGAGLALALARLLPEGRRGLAWLALAAPPLLVLALLADPVEVTRPALRGFNFQGGVSLSPEFVALVVALTVYQAGFMAETIRSGILGVASGQAEAAAALGLRRGQALRLVVFPQALRIVIPPVTSQYLSLTKNSSLAVVIGYPDLVRVSQVTISETGRAVECISILLLVYLSLSLGTAALMGLYNRRVMARGGGAR